MINAKNQKVNTSRKNFFALENFLTWLETPREFQDIDAEFRKSELLAPVWKVLEKSLTKTSDAAYSTTDAAEFFTAQNFTRGMNMTFWQAYGGIFTGLGILGTFAGLTFGLSDIDMTSGDVETLKAGIAKLLSGVNTAFVTSLVGILAALFYSGIHHWLLTDFQGKVNALAEKLDEIFPRRSAENWLTETYSESREQTTALKNIGTDVSDAINDLLDQRMDEALEILCAKLEEKILPQTDRICSSIENLNGNLSTAVGKIEPVVDKICAAIEKLGSKELGEVISEGVGSKMERFSQSLDKFSDSIDKKLENANKISEIMNEQMINTLKELGDTLRQQSETERVNRGAEYQKFLDTLNALIETLKTQQEGTAENFATLLKTALDNFNAVMARVTAESKGTSEQFLATLTGLMKTLQEVADKTARQQENSVNNFESLIKKLLDDLSQFTEQQREFLNRVANSNAQQISEAVAAFREIVNRHNETTQRTFAQIQNHLTETERFLQQVNTAGNSLRQAAEPVRQSTLQLNQNLLETSAQMKTLATANQYTRENLQELSGKLRTFVDNFNGIADELERSTEIIYNSLENYNGKMNEELRDNLKTFDESMTNAVGHLQSLVDDFSDMVGYVKQKRR